MGGSGDVCGSLGNLTSGGVPLGASGPLGGERRSGVLGRAGTSGRVGVGVVLERPLFACTTFRLTRSSFLGLPGPAEMVGPRSNSWASAPKWLRFEWFSRVARARLGVDFVFMRTPRGWAIRNVAPSN